MLVSDVAARRYVVAVLFITLFACGRKTGPTADSNGFAAAAVVDGSARDHALVRLLNADPQTGAADLWFGDTRVAASTPYRGASRYQQIPVEGRQFRVRATGFDNQAPLATDRKGLWRGQNYTIVFWRDEFGRPRLETLTDDLQSLSVGMARVRIIHTAPALNSLDIGQGGESYLFLGVRAGETTRYRDVEPFEGKLQIYANGTAGSSLSSTTVSLQTGQHYTIVITGSDAKHIETVLIPDTGS